VTGLCCVCKRPGAPFLCFKRNGQPVYLHETKACEAKFEVMPINPPTKRVRLA
jgi:hypothetical protein